MSEATKIEWCDSTFNPWIGCTKISPACDHCYAEAQMGHNEQHRDEESLKEALCLASAMQIPTGRIAAFIYGLVRREAEINDEINADLLDRLTATAEEFPSAFLAGKEAFDRMLEIAIEMGPMADG